MPRERSNTFSVSNLATNNVMPMKSGICARFLEAGASARHIRHPSALKATAKGLSVFWIASPARSSGGSARTEKLANVVSKIENTRDFIDRLCNSGWYYLDRHLILLIAPGLAAGGYSADLSAVRRSDEVGLHQHA
jgi:hypothetical protein